MSREYLAQMCEQIERELKNKNHTFGTTRIPGNLKEREMLLWEILHGYGMRFCRASFCVHDRLWIPDRPEHGLAGSYVLTRDEGEHPYVFKYQVAFNETMHPWVYANTYPHEVLHLLSIPELMIPAP